MAGKSEIHLSRRERQIMDIVFRRGQASAAEVHRDLPDRPSYSAVRATLRILEEKGHLTHKKAGARYIYAPTRPRREASRSALRRVVETFFDGSLEKAVAALLDRSAVNISPEELDRVAKLIDQARKEGR